MIKFYASISKFCIFFNFKKNLKNLNFFLKKIKEIHKLSAETLENMEAWPIKATKAAPISRKLEIP